MKIRKWSSREKTMIVMEGLAGKTVAQICSEHGIGKSMYYKWRDIFISKSHKAFEINRPNLEVEKLKTENRKLKQVIGDLSLELKKNEEVYG